MTKRKLSFDSLPEVAEEIQRLRTGRYAPTRNWNLSQVCEHLDKTMRSGMEGSIKPLPWIIRGTVFRLLTEYILYSGYMPGGAPAPPEIAPGAHPEDDPGPIDACLVTLAAAHAFQGPLPPHPFSTGMTIKKWRRLMCVHSAHHLGYLNPAG